MVAQFRMELQGTKESFKRYSGQQMDLWTLLYAVALQSEYWNSQRAAIEDDGKANHASHDGLREQCRWKAITLFHDL
jgi:hypothetical protein